MPLGRMLKAGKSQMSRALNRPGPRATGRPSAAQVERIIQSRGKPNMPMVPSKLPAPRTNVTTGLGSKVAGASTSKPMPSSWFKGIKSPGKIASKTMMKKGGAVKKAKPRSKK